jgi:hypothetical protein
MSNERKYWVSQVFTGSVRCDYGMYLLYSWSYSKIQPEKDVKPIGLRGLAARSTCNEDTLVFFYVDGCHA